METYRTETNDFQNPSPKNEFNLPAPNSNAILTLGILSIVTCCCCNGIIGIILSIIAIILATKSKREFKRNSDIYNEKTLGKVNAGRTCAIIGLTVGILMFVIAIIVVHFALDDVSSIATSVNGWDGLGY
ncbi:MAG: hypothetical protein J6T48_00235 [Bacteroidales bacterium]|nr:hypothetical protein [Bacteroidales bacterium]